MLCEIDKCTGCSSCANVCPVRAIEMIEDNEGFIQPVVNKILCTKCGLCESVCPIINQKVFNKERNKFAFAFWNINSETRSCSSSGGLFYALADYTLKNLGVVYGAAYDDQVCVKHIRVTNYNSLKRLQTSKYVQSIIGDCFVKVKKDLNDNKFVLFSGTPCQVAGLYGYLGKDYYNLFTCDFVCHGVPSPGVFREYIKFQESTFGSKVTSINFRAKSLTTSQNLIIDFENGKKIIKKEILKDPFLWGFLVGIIDRKSCSKCAFTGFNKRSDITMGDFWGLSERLKNNSGLDSYPSLVLLNNEKGSKVFNTIWPKHVVIKRPVTEAIYGNLNLRRPLKEHKLRKYFFIEYAKKTPFSILAKKYLVQQKTKNDYIKIILGPTLTNLFIRLFKR